MDLTRDRIINTIPLGTQLRQKLLNEWDKLSPDNQFTIENLLWDTYYSFYQMRLQENIQLMIKQSKEKHLALDNSFYDKVQAQTEKDMETETIETADDSEISAVRQKIQNLL